MRSGVNLKWEMAVSLAIIAFVLLGTMWNIAPFSTIMNLGQKAKHSWETAGAMSGVTGRGEWANRLHGYEVMPATYRGGSSRGRGWAAPAAGIEDHEPFNDVRGRGRRGISQGYYRTGGRFREKGRGYGQWNEPVERETPARLKGRDIVRLGKMDTLSGTLKQKGDEWEIEVGDTIYEIHMGPAGYGTSKGLLLKDGESAHVTGLVFGTDVAVSTIETGGKSVTLRDETGRPAWAGTGFSRRGGGGIR